MLPAQMGDRYAGSRGQLRGKARSPRTTAGSHAPPRNRCRAGVAAGSVGPVRDSLWATLQELEHLGIGFVSLTEALDLTPPAGRAMAGLLAIFAEFEREILRERTRDRAVFRSAGPRCVVFWPALLLAEIYSA